MAELIKSKGSGYLLHIDGFLYYKNSGAVGARAYWLCKNNPDCEARAITAGGADNLRLVKGSPDDHLHAPVPDQVKAEKVINHLKRQAESQPEAPPSQILRTSLRDVPSG